MTELWAEWINAETNTLRRGRFPIQTTQQHHKWTCKTGWRTPPKENVCIHDSAYYRSLPKEQVKKGRARRGSILFVRSEVPLEEIMNDLREYLLEFHDIKKDSLTIEMRK